MSLKVSAKRHSGNPNYFAKNLPDLSNKENRTHGPWDQISLAPMAVYLIGQETKKVSSLSQYDK